jgi:hypothetical protein
MKTNPKNYIVEWESGHKNILFDIVEIGLVFDSAAIRFEKSNNLFKIIFIRPLRSITEYKIPDNVTTFSVDVQDKW